MKTVLFCSTLLFLFAGCASSSFTRIGQRTDFVHVPDSVPILVYTKEDEIEKPFVPVGIVSYTNPGKFRVMTLADAIPALQEKARLYGANAIIIDATHAIKSGFLSVGITVTARAIRIRG